VSREPRLVERRADAGPAAEPPKLWWHEVRIEIVRRLERRGRWKPRVGIERGRRRAGRNEGRGGLMGKGRRIEVSSSSMSRGDRERSLT
jgi:hypothetical protein